jgi:hypothetical protein
MTHTTNTDTENGLQHFAWQQPCLALRASATRSRSTLDEAGVTARSCAGQNGPWTIQSLTEMARRDLKPSTLRPRLRNQDPFGDGSVNTPPSGLNAARKDEAKWVLHGGRPEVSQFATVTVTPGLTPETPPAYEATLCSV